MALIADIGESDIKLKELKLENDEKAEEKGSDQDGSGDTNDANTKLDSKIEKTSKKMTNKPKGSKNANFDTVIGYIEDMLIDDDFHHLQKSFLEKYWEEFVNSEENKHSYMEIFTEYTNEIENFIEKYLCRLMPDFVMDSFITQLEQKKGELEGEVFEVLFTLTDFEAFKEMFLDYRSMKEGNVVDLGNSLSITSIP